MALVLGTGPFGEQPAGEFNFSPDPPRHVLYFEDIPKRVRVELGGQTVADSDAMKLLHESGRVPVYCFPEDDVRQDFLERRDARDEHPAAGPQTRFDVRVRERVAEQAAWCFRDPPQAAAFLHGYVGFEWDAMDAWYEEDEQVFVHPHDPYHRVDVRVSSRRVRIHVEGELVAESTRPLLLFETSLPVRYYLPRDDVRMDLLDPVETVTHCPYKGQARYWAVKAGDRQVDGVVWSYENPLGAVQRIQDYICFLNERVDLEVDGQPQVRPHTKFS